MSAEVERWREVAEPLRDDNEDYWHTPVLAAGDALAARVDELEGWLGGDSLVHGLTAVECRDALGRGEEVRP